MSLFNEISQSVLSQYDPGWLELLSRDLRKIQKDQNPVCACENSLYIFLVILLISYMLIFLFFLFFAFCSEVMFSSLAFFFRYRS